MQETLVSEARFRDTPLHKELDIADGLADPRVVLLDPCCGTAAYVRAALRRIARTLAEKGGDALVAQELKAAAMDRVFGFEILPAPFVVAHLQIGLLLESLGAPLSETKMDRAGVYLTNALTGWEPAKDPKTLLLFPELEEERNAADRIKREARILVVIGNPSYNGYAGVAVDEERSLTDAYRTTRRAPAPQGQGLNDLYVRFFRYKTGKLTPEGDPDPSVFSTEFNREGIQVGTAIGLLVRKSEHGEGGAPTVRFRHLWGKTKREQLLHGAGPYQELAPIPALGLSFMPGATSAGYTAWPLLPELFPVSFPGVKTSRDDFSSSNFGGGDG